MVLTTESYTFRIRHDDSFKLTIGSNVASAGCCSDDSTVTWALTAGTVYDFELKFDQNKGPKYVQLSWQTNTIPLQAVPASAFY